MSPFEIERMQWEEGDTIAGLLLEADAKLGHRRVPADLRRHGAAELEIEETEAVSAPAEPLVVPVGPGEPGRSFPQG